MSNIFVFDMGGVITRSYCLRGLFDELHSPIRYSEFKYYVYCSPEAEAAYKGLGDINDYFKKMIEVLQIKMTPEELKKMYLAYKGALYQYTLLIMDFLKQRGNKICLFSNLHEVDYEYLGKAMDLNVFDRQYLSFKSHLVKPDEEFYREVINDLGTRDFYFFDDKQRNVNAAVDLGINGIKTTGDEIGQTFKKIKGI